MTDLNTRTTKGIRLQLPINISFMLQPFPSDGVADAGNRRRLITIDPAGAFRPVGEASGKFTRCISRGRHKNEV